jgi:hypothetical protein
MSFRPALDSPASNSDPNRCTALVKGTGVRCSTALRRVTGRCADLTE